MGHYRKRQMKKRTFTFDDDTDKRLRELSNYFELSDSATIRRVVKESHERTAREILKSDPVLAKTYRKLFPKRKAR